MFFLNIYLPQARNLGAYKLARHVLEKIQSLRVPVRFSITRVLLTISHKLSSNNDGGQVPGQRAAGLPDGEGEALP